MRSSQTVILLLAILVESTFAACGTTDPDPDPITKVAASTVTSYSIVRNEGGSVEFALTMYGGGCDEFDHVEIQRSGNDVVITPYLRYVDDPRYACAAIVKDIAASATVSLPAAGTYRFRLPFWDKRYLDTLLDVR